MIAIIFSNFIKTTFNSWQVWWEDIEGNKLNKCKPEAVYRIKTRYFWFIAFRTKFKMSK